MKKLLSFILLICMFMLVSCQNNIITETEAVKLAKSHIESIESEDYIELITNFDAPTVEKLDFDKSNIVYYFKARNSTPHENDLKGKKVWKIIFTTTLDPFLGSHIIYIDRYSGKLYGTDLRT